MIIIIIRKQTKEELGICFSIIIIYILIRKLKQYSVLLSTPQHHIHSKKKTKKCLKYMTNLNLSTIDIHYHKFMHETMTHISSLIFFLFFLSKRFYFHYKCQEIINQIIYGARSRSKN